MFHKALYQTLFAVGMVTLIAAEQSMAEEEFTLVPAVSIKEEYNDNVNFSTTKDSSFITVISPSVTLLQRSERLKSTISARLDLLDYSSASDLNATDQYYWGTADYQFTPLFKGGATASFISDSPTDRVLESSGLVIRSPRDQQDYSLTGTYLFTEKLEGSLTYAYQQINYDANQLTDIFAHFVNAQMEYDIDKHIPLVKVRGDVGYSHIDYSSSAVDVASVDTYSATVGAIKSLHELWSFSADVGGRVSDYTFYGPPKSTDQQFGWIAKMALEYRDDLTRGSINFIHNLQNITGYAVPTEQTSVTGQISHKFSHELTGTLFAGYYLNSAEDNDKFQQSTDETTYLISPGVTYDFTRNLNLNLTYEYANLHDRRYDYTADRNRIFARLTYQYPIPIY